MLGFRQSGPTSNRKTILVKGYQSWAGRALVAFQAFRRCLDVLKGYTIVLYAVVDDVKIAARLFEQETGIPIKIVPPFSPEQEILSQFGAARIYVGLSISDGISTSLLEAMVMGAFPIQSCTACANEWIQDGISGIIVPPEEPVEIANAIRRALTDDRLVDQAAEINMKTAKERLDYSVIQPQAIKIYQDIYESQLRNRSKS
ncbi:MAG TPA: glycosyltransferase [Anaerolineales bacterium]|nr:glycosyltransferase [Anaerolineales bacterium]